MNEALNMDSQIRFSWFRDDLESKIGIRGSRYTGVNSLLWFIVSAFLTGAFYGILQLLPAGDYFDHFRAMLQRSWTQVVVVLFSFWSLLILFLKSRKSKLQRATLDFTDLVPIEADFVLSPATVGMVLSRLRHACDDPSRFILFNRIELALSNLKNMGQIGDVDNVLQSQAANDDDVMESSYSLIKGLIWAIPVLGFIGTVLGLADAIGGFDKVLDTVADFDEMAPKLKDVLGGLKVAFETTLVALVLALVIQLLLTFVRKGEEELLDACKEYCQRFVVGKLRLTLFDHVD